MVTQAVKIQTDLPPERHYSPMPADGLATGAYALMYGVQTSIGVCSRFDQA